MNLNSSFSPLCVIRFFKEQHLRFIIFSLLLASLPMGARYANADTMAYASASTLGGGCSDTGVATAGCTSAYYVPGTKSFVLGDSVSSAGAYYGLLGASSGSSASAYNEDGSSDTSASAVDRASFTDTYFIYGPKDTSGYLEFTQVLTGHATVASNPSGPGDTVTGNGSNATAFITFGSSVTGEHIIGTSGDSVTEVDDVPFYLGFYDAATGEYFGDFSFAMTLEASTACTALGYDDEPSPRAGTCSASAYYSNTLRVISVLPFDSNGNPITDVKLVSASGTDYNNISESIVTPEPSTFVLFSLGASLTLLWKHRAAGTHPNHL